MSSWVRFGHDEQHFARVGGKEGERGFDKEVGCPTPNSEVVAVVGSFAGRHLLQFAGHHIHRGASGFEDIGLSHAAPESALGLVEHEQQAQNDEGEQAHGDHDLD